MLVRIYHSIEFFIATPILDDIVYGRPLTYLMAQLFFVLPGYIQNI